jgi:hypothetical protein
MPSCFAEFYESYRRGQFKLVNDFYRIARLVAVPLALSPTARNLARQSLRAPIEAIRNQELFETENKALNAKSVFSVLRANRIAAPEGPDPADWIDREREQNGCDWCTGNVRGLMRDSFGVVRSPDGRFIGHANFSRQAPINGIVTGDRDAHNFLKLSAADSRQMWETVGLYIARARSAVPGLRYIFCGWNGGFKSAMSLMHCHLNILGWTHRHCGFAEQVAARCPPQYWTRLQHLHDQIGLGFRYDDVTGFASLCPVKEREICFQSRDLISGAVALHRVLRVLFERGTNNFSVAAILSPSVVGATVRRFGDWPGVLWRVVDRGDMRTRHSDIGAVEMLGGATVYSADPWPVAAWLRAGPADVAQALLPAASRLPGFGPVPGVSTPVRRVDTVSKRSVGRSAASSHPNTGEKDGLDK